MYTAVSRSSKEPLTAKQDDDDLDIKSGDVYVSISKEDILKSPEAAMFIVRFIEATLQEAGN